MAEQLDGGLGLRIRLVLGERFTRRLSGAGRTYGTITVDCVRK